MKQKVISLTAIIACFILLIAALSLLVTGCWDRIELEELAIVVAMGIDYDPKEKVFEVTSAIVRPQKPTGSGQTSQETESFYLLTTRGTTLSAALEQKNALLSSRPFYSHNDIVIIGETLAREGLHLILDRLVRERDMRLTVNMIITPENVKEIMRSGSRAESGFPLELRQRMHVRNQRSLNPVKQLYLFLQDLLQAGIDPVLPLLTSQKKTPAPPQEIEQGGQTGEEKEIKYPKLSGSAVFREDKLVGFLNIHETKGLLYIRGDIVGATETIEDPYKKPGKIVLTTSKAKTKITPLWEKEKPRVLLEVREKGDICCQSTASNIYTTEAFHLMQKEKEKIITAHIRAALEKSQKWQADIFGIGREFHRRMPEKWKIIQKNWRKIYANLEVDIKVESQIKRTGLTEKAPFYEYHTGE